MKRYESRVEKVLRVRRLQEDIARGEVALARRDEAAAQAAASATQGQYAELVSPTGAQPATAFLGWSDRAAYRATAVVAALDRHHTAQQQTASALQTWRHVHQDVEGLERLDDRRRGEHHVELLRAEDAVVDETIVARLRRGSP